MNTLHDPLADIGRLQLAIISLSDRLARIEHHCGGCHIPTGDADILANVLAGLSLPRTPFTLQKQGRLNVISVLRDRGWSKSRIARALQISECSVYRCIKRLRLKQAKQEGKNHAEQNSANSGPVPHHSPITPGERRANPGRSAPGKNHRRMDAAA